MNQQTPSLPGIIALSDNLNTAIGCYVDHFDANHGRINDKMSAIVESYV